MTVGKNANLHSMWCRAGGCLLLLGLSLAYPCLGWSFEVVETPEGQVLLQDVRQEEKKPGLSREGERDPFNWARVLVEQHREKSRPTGESLFQGLQLSGIFADTKMPLAIIDDTVLHEGDIIKGAVVRSIARDEVLLERENEYHTLRFTELLELKNRGGNKAGAK